MALRSIPPKGSIPPSVRGNIGVRIGIGGLGSARSGGTPSSTAFPLHGKPSKPIMKLSLHGLEEMLDWGLEEEKRCQDLLRMLPPAMPEYQSVLASLDKLRDSLAIIRKQLAVRKE